MAIPPAIPELQTGEAADMLDNFKKGVISLSEEIELFELINQVKKKYQKTFKIAEVLKKSFDFTAFDTRRFETNFNKWLKRQEKEDTPATEPIGPAAPAIVAKAREVGIGATKALLGELQELGNILTLQYGQKAALRGLGVKDYVLKCVDFYEQYGDRTEAMIQENESLKALTSILVQAVKPQFKIMAASRMYLDFITQLMQLSTLGYEIDENVVNEVHQKLELAMGIKFS